MNVFTKTVCVYGLLMNIMLCLYNKGLEVAVFPKRGGIPYED